MHPCCRNRLDSILASAVVNQLGYTESAYTNSPLKDMHACRLLNEPDAAYAMGTQAG